MGISRAAAGATRAVRQAWRVLDLHRPATAVAPDLLGCLLSCGPVTVRLTEVEAYEGEDDPASHAWRGPTPRTRVMFGPPGRMYVYLSYGIHYAMNVVCGDDGRASAVLLRAGEVIRGVPIATERRAGRRRRLPPAALASGPGCLSQALDVTLAHNDSPILLPGEEADASGPVDPLVLHPREAVPQWTRGPRIGISRAREAELRFWIVGDRTVSGRRGPANGSRDGAGTARLDMS